MKFIKTEKGSTQNPTHDLCDSQLFMINKQRVY